MYFKRLEVKGDAWSSADINQHSSIDSRKIWWPHAAIHKTWWMDSVESIKATNGKKKDVYNPASLALVPRTYLYEKGLRDGSRAGGIDIAIWELGWIKPPPLENEHYPFSRCFKYCIWSPLLAFSSFRPQVSEIIINLMSKLHRLPSQCLKLDIWASTWLNWSLKECDLNFIRMALTSIPAMPKVIMLLGTSQAYQVINKRKSMEST